MSDYQDALHIQCVASFFFLFLATLTPNITFGGLLGEKTDNYMVTLHFIFLYKNDDGRVVCLGGRGNYLRI